MPTPAASTWKNVRVFISSTFRDMQAERDHLVRFIFPRLREELRSRRIHLLDVDLRWGVTSEQDAREVCREIVDECRPRFLCMLGGRYGWVPEGEDHSITDDEVHYGVLDRAKDERGFSFFYFRDETATTAIVETQPGEFREPLGSLNEKRLADLKQEIVDEDLNPFTYTTTWDNENRRLIGLDTFGKQVYSDLVGSLKADPELTDRFVSDHEAQIDEFDEENDAIEAFVEEKCERFVLGSRDSALHTLLDHALGTGDNGYLCLRGSPGSGKSALLAYLSRIPALTDHSSILHIRHFVGVSPNSTGISRTLRRLCHELKEGCPDISDDIPHDPEELSVAFSHFLQRASESNHVVILLDAVNQFDTSQQFEGLGWLPDNLPLNARIILSTLDSPLLDRMRARRSPPKEVMLEALTAADSKAIINQFTNRYRKRFEPEQCAMLLVKNDAGTPLYLLAALEELRTLGTYEEITERIERLPSTTAELFGWILKRLENDDGFRNAAGKRIGPDLVPKFASLLGASRFGLSQSELFDLLDPDDPQGNVAGLLRLLRPYLMHRGDLIDFYHGQFRSAVTDLYLKTELQQRSAHSQLVGYFEGLPTWISLDDMKPTLRRTAELPYHLAWAGMEDHLAELLLEDDLLDSVVFGLGPFEAIRDIEYVLTPVSPPSINVITESTKALVHLRDALRLSQHVLAPYPEELPSQLFGRLLDSGNGVIDQFLEGFRLRTHRPWLRPVTASLIAPGGPLVRTLIGHTDIVRAVAVTPDGCTIISGGDKTIKLWDLESGRELHTLIGHTKLVNAVAITSDGRTIVSGSDDKTIKVWSLDSGRELHTLTGNPSFINTLAVTPDGHIIVSGSFDGTLKVWDLVGGRELYTLVGHAGWVTALVITPDGHTIVSGSFDGTIKVWDLGSGRELHNLPGHVEGCMAVAISPDGRTIITGSWDKIVRVWDLESGHELRTLVGHTGWVAAVAITPDGHTIVSGSFDGTVKVWDLESGQTIHTLVGHIGWVQVVAITTDGRTIISGSHDKTIKVWDLESGRELHTLAGHTSEVTAVAIGPDGRSIISGSSDSTIRVWNLESGTPLTGFSANGGISICAISGLANTIILGDNVGTIHFLRLENISSDPHIITSQMDARGCTVPVLCPYCRHRTMIQDNELGNVMICISCHRPFRLNPTVAETPVEIPSRGTLLSQLRNLFSWRR